MCLKVTFLMYFFQLFLSSMNPSSSPSLDHNSRSLDSPDSPSGSITLSGVGGSPGRGCDSTSPHRDRRVGHIHAEQKRRYNIKNGFEMIQSLIPHLNQNPNAKVSSFYSELSYDLRSFVFFSSAKQRCYKKARNIFAS